MAGLTRAKAKLILKEGVVRGRPLTKPQRGFFGARAGGAPVRNVRNRRIVMGALSRHRG